MRPLELRIEGFRSYDRPVVFDWRARHLVGIVGPIGSGKTSILDAIAFALYGKTPVFERESKTLIHQASDHLRVRLDFEVEGEAWRAVRVVKRRGVSQHALYRRQGLLEAERERQMTARIEQLLGLDFAAFNRSVLLAQNRFAQFLHASPGERDKVLKGVFGFDRIDAMHAAARARRSGKEAEVAALEGRLAGLGADREQRAAARHAAQVSAERRERLAAAAPAIDASLAADDEAKRRFEQAIERLRAVEAVAEQMPDSTAVSVQARAVTEQQKALAEAQQRLDTARSALRAAKKEHADATASTSAADLARAEQALDALERARQRFDEEKKHRGDMSKAIAAADRAHADTVAAHRASRDGEQAAADALERARAARATAEHELRAAEVERMALTVRRAVAAGDACPVCGQPVAELPHEASASDPGLARAETRVAARRDDESEARRAHQEATKQAVVAEQAVADADAGRGRARARFDEADERLRATDQEVGMLKVQLTDLLGLGDPAEQIARLTARLTAAEERLAAARQAEDEAEEHRERTRAGLEEARASAGRSSHRLANLAGSLGAEADASLDLEALARQVERAIADQRTTAIAERDRAHADRRAAGAKRATLLADLGLDADTDFAAAVAEADRRAGHDQAEAERLEEVLAQAEQATADLEHARTDLKHLRQLSEDLTAPRFLRYLLDEERAALADLGSERFEMLSGGRYRFADDGSFAVVDLANAEAERKAETLSGGETFLASLALALALAETVTSSGGRLDAFFLDEGFGALDEEHLDLALDGIERLVADSPNRLVCVVSHVAALTERVDDLIVLDKDPLTGASRVVRGGRHVDGIEE